MSHAVMLIIVAHDKVKPQNVTAFVYACMRACLVYIWILADVTGIVSARMQQVMFDDDDRVCQYPYISVIRSVVVSRKANGRYTEKGFGLAGEDLMILSVCLSIY